MASENIKDQEGKEGDIQPTEGGPEFIKEEVKPEGTKKPEEGVLSPEQVEEIEKRKKERRGELIKRERVIEEEELPEEKKQTAEEVLSEAYKPGPLGTTPSEETIVDRLVKMIIDKKQSLEDVLRALKKEGKISLFDTFRDKLTEDENWQKLKELGEVEIE